MWRYSEEIKWYYIRHCVKRLCRWSSNSQSNTDENVKRRRRRRRDFSVDVTSREFQSPKLSQWKESCSNSTCCCHYWNRNNWRSNRNRRRRRSPSRWDDGTRGISSNYWSRRGRGTGWWSTNITDCSTNWWTNHSNRWKKIDCSFSHTFSEFWKSNLSFFSTSFCRSTDTSEYSNKWKYFDNKSHTCWTTNSSGIHWETKRHNTTASTNN